MATRQRISIKVLLSLIFNLVLGVLSGVRTPLDGLFAEIVGKKPFLCSQFISKPSPEEPKLIYTTRETTQAFNSPAAIFSNTS